MIFSLQANRRHIAEFLRNQYFSERGLTISATEYEVLMEMNQELGIIIAGFKADRKSELHRKAGNRQQAFARVLVELINSQQIEYPKAKALFCEFIRNAGITLPKRKDPGSLTPAEAMLRAETERNEHQRIPA